MGPTVAGLFAGVGGIELGLRRAGWESALLCEIDPAAQAVLRRHFPDAPLVGDVRGVEALPECDLVAGGFPCQDLSMAGNKRGIGGERSGLVGELFRLLRRRPAPWLLLENVPYMLHLRQGEAMRLLVRALEGIGYRWAYRVVDARGFGVPQRRKRLLLLASLAGDPCGPLLGQDEGAPPPPDDLSPIDPSRAYGFYWTEGLRGIGWAVDAIPTLKNGSTVGIASPPAVWQPSLGTFGTPDIRDAERLQGFPEDWTLDAATGHRKGARWGLVGNAVCVPVAEWIGGRLRHPSSFDAPYRRLREAERWPDAAWGAEGKAFVVEASAYPAREAPPALAAFLLTLERLQQPLHVGIGRLP
ncbi:MAG: DNA (cytosine-5-)-methyltransferase [Gemmataceae bacterium]|nr:DNA (cytosine-5-)-methyltransferase [Gemmataceae bacterium]